MDVLVKLMFIKSYKVKNLSIFAWVQVSCVMIIFRLSVGSI